MVPEKQAHQSPAAATTTTTAAAEDPNGCSGDTPIAASFTPTNSFRNRLEGFTDFLIAHLSDWSKSQPPWPSPPPIAFSGSERAIKGRLPHRKLALSSFLPIAPPPLSSHAAANAESANLLSSKVRPSLDIAAASVFLAQEAPLASCALDHPQITDAVTNSISSDRSELPILNAASPISENHSSLPVPSPGSHPLYESPGAFVFSNSYDVYPSSDGGPASELFRSSTSSSLLSSYDLACTTCRQPMCSCTPLLTAHGCPLQCADSSKVSPLRGLIDGSASVTADSRVIDTHLMCRQFDREVPLSSCALDIASGSVPYASLEIHDGHSTVPALSPIVHSMPEFSSLDSLKTDEGKFLGELNGNVVGNVGMELNGSLEHDEEGHELEEGELSDQECSEKTASAETFQDHEESVDHEESASLDKGPSDDITRQQSSKVQGIAVANAMGSLTGIMLPRYFTRSSVRKGVAEKGHARESNKKRKSSDHHDESEKRKKTSRKKRKSEKQQGDVPKQRGSSGSWTTGKDGQQLCVQNGNKAAVGKKRECSPSVEEREHMKQKQEAVMKATVQPALPVNETVTVQEDERSARMWGMLNAVLPCLVARAWATRWHFSYFFALEYVE